MSAIAGGSPAPWRAQPAASERRRADAGVRVGLGEMRVA